MSKCPPIYTLEQAAAGELSTEQEALLHQHLQQCPACGTLFLMLRARQRLEQPHRVRAALAKAARITALRIEIRELHKQSDSCPWCRAMDGCWCDGDWSPEAQLFELERQLLQLLHERRELIGPRVYPAAAACGGLPREKKS